VHACVCAYVLYVHAYVHAYMFVVMCYQSHVVTGTSSDLVVHVKSLEFADFLKHPGCTNGEHVWKPTGEEIAATQLCRSVAPPLNIIHYYCKELPLCFTYYAILDYLVVLNYFLPFCAGKFYYLDRNTSN